MLTSHFFYFVIFNTIFLKVNLCYGTCYIRIRLFQKVEKLLTPPRFPVDFTIQARRKQLESGAAKTEEIHKTPQQKGFLFFYFKKSNLDRKKPLRQKPALPQCFRRPCNTIIFNYFLLMMWSLIFFFLIFDVIRSRFFFLFFWKSSTITTIK